MAFDGFEELLLNIVKGWLSSHLYVESDMGVDFLEDSLQCWERLVVRGSVV